jgi:acyl carrier protein
MTAQYQTITASLEDIVRRFTPKNPALHLGPTTHLIDEAGIDSPRMIDIVLEVEDRFGITVDDDDIQKVRTFGDLVVLVTARSAQEPE